jgi:hypothetical protein
MGYVQHVRPQLMIQTIKVIHVHALANKQFIQTQQINALAQAQHICYQMQVVYHVYLDLFKIPLIKHNVNVQTTIYCGLLLIIHVRVH